MMVIFMQCFNAGDLVTGTASGLLQVLLQLSPLWDTRPHLE